jgi:hypothetical protein
LISYTSAEAEAPKARGVPAVLRAEAL